MAQFSAQTIADDLNDASLCWDADDDGDCADASEARATLTFEILGTGTVGSSTDPGDVDLTAEAPENPFERVVFYVQLVDGDDPGIKWAYLGEGRGRAPIDTPPSTPSSSSAGV